jgi:hypothetical protein
VAGSPYAWVACCKSSRSSSDIDVPTTCLLVEEQTCIANNLGDVRAVGRAEGEFLVHGLDTG